ncbi:nitrate reductase molybdenum cofactor assembly chaperone [Streptacidiphilus rugosus]|uniref:nitrate reductase molybdenum cofactor assembly chaperone n=1 Tax=Streptacidiphilus rugosus TaxID=405783 RepID=UPI00055E1FEE|nr:nitrate reductase molybdenum cofactor assembly chaperone [Streptacidiphilus rugosus]
MSRTSFDTAVVHQAAAWLLTYPDADLAADLPLLRAAVGAVRGPAAAQLGGFIDHADATGVAGLAYQYTEVFDFGHRHSLYLSWWSDGDTRRRGAALLAFKQAYRAAGYAPTDEELPDFLPAVLEFSARTRDDTLLREHRAGLELLRLALSEAGTPYADVLVAVCATLPGPSPADRAQALALARSGPPREDVGLGGELPPYGHLAQLPVLATGGR